MSEVTPAEMERDKQIAEMRGDAYTTIEGCVYCEHYIPVINCLRCGCSESNIKPYSTDISYASELWEEMIQVGTYFDLRTRKTIHNEYRVRAFSGNNLLFLGHDCKTLAEAMASAISGAWLKWKEGK